MNRITTLIALLVLALPLAAAPVPKAVKVKSAAPPLAGTKWTGVHDGAGIGTAEYEFRDNGVLACTKRDRQTTTDNTWAQDGDTLTWEMNNGFSKYTCTYADAVFEGTAVNKNGARWKVKLTPAEKK